MSTLVNLLRGFPGKPLHPPLTDASIGAYTVGVAMLVIGALGVEEEQMAHGSLLAISGGLILALPTALTGLLDWLNIERGTPARTTATIHLFTMVSATALFALTWIVQLDGYKDDVVKTGAWILGVGGEALLTAGGYIGGSLVFVYGVRVLSRRDARVADALVPGRADRPAPTSGGIDRGSEEG
jgi:uncharacterized membrane protein